MASPPARKRARRVVPFLECHEYLYGVRVVERDPDSNEVKSVLCMFCAAFGREDDPRASSRLRARTRKPKYWDGPTFRTDNYKSHLTMQHPVVWQQYQDLSVEQKQSYFDAVPALPKTNGKPRKMAATTTSTTSLQPPIETSSELKNETSMSAPESPSPEPQRVSIAADAVSIQDKSSSPVSNAVQGAGEGNIPSVVKEEEQDRPVLTFLLDRDVMDVVLGDGLFRAEGEGNDHAVVVFESTLDEQDAQNQERSGGTAEYRAVVRSVELFHRVVTLLAVGLSFDQTDVICRSELTTGVRDNSFVVQMARVVVGANLQVLASVLQRSWAFSLSLHCVGRRRSGETESRIFLDVRLRVCCLGKIEVFHLLSLPVTTGGDPNTTGESMFDTMEKFIETLDKHWLHKVIGCSTKVIGPAGSTASSAVMSAVAQSIAQKVEQQTRPELVRVSSARPPLDALVQRFFDSFLFADASEWHSQLTRLSAYLQRQVTIGNAEELSAASVASCPHVFDVAWWKVLEVARWFDNARVPIQRLLARKNASVTPPPVWWLNLKVAIVVGSMAIKTREGLQGGYATLLSQQPQRISMLRLALAGDVGVEGPLPAYQRAALRDRSSMGDTIGSSDSMFAVKPHAIVTFIREMGGWAADVFDALSAKDRQKVIVCTADRMLDLIQGLHRLAEELEEYGGSSNSSLSSFPPVLPHQVALLHPADFQEIIHVHRPRLIETFSATKIAAVETQHRELRTAAANDASVRQLLDISAENLSASFDESWGMLRNRWGILVEVCGGLATVFPSSNTDAVTTSPHATVATGFMLADFPLEARLQCQQFTALQDLDGRMYR